MARKVAAAGALVTVALALGACGVAPSPSTTPPTTLRASDGSSPTPTATPTPSSAPSLTSADDLVAGDCLASVREPVVEVAVVDCAEPHMHEVFAVLEHEATAEEGYPGAEALTRYADDICLGPFEDYVAVDYLDSAYWITSIVPAEAGWADGDRRIVCTLRLGQEGRETTGSARASGD